MSHLTVASSFDSRKKWQGVRSDYTTHAKASRELFEDEFTESLWISKIRQVLSEIAGS
jgi:hypothetical protein